MFRKSCYQLVKHYVLRKPTAMSQVQVNAQPLGLGFCLLETWGWYFACIWTINLKEFLLNCHAKI